MSKVGFEPMFPLFKRTKTVHALDRAAIVIGRPVVLALENEDSGVWISFQEKPKCSKKKF
jgi:hypothetical protein